MTIDLEDDLRDVISQIFEERTDLMDYWIDQMEEVDYVNEEIPPV